MVPLPDECLAHGSNLPEHLFLTNWRFGKAFGHRKSRPWRIVGDGQVHAMQAGDGRGYAQTDAAARFAAGFAAANEAPEDVVRLSGGHAAPIVVDFDTGQSVFQHRRDVDGAAARREFQRIIDEIGDGLAHEIGVADLVNGRCWGEAHGDALGLGQWQEKLMQFSAKSGQIHVPEGGMAPFVLDGGNAQQGGDRVHRTIELP